MHSLLRSINLQKWFLAIILFLICFLHYYESFAPAAIKNLIPDTQFALYLLFFVLAVLFSFHKENFSVATQWNSLFVFGIVGLNAALVLLFPEGNHISKLRNSVEVMSIFLSSLLIVVMIKRDVLISILSRLYFAAFIIGMLFIGATHLKILAPSEILNENTIGFFLAPFLIYLFISQRKIMIRVIIYIIGIILIYLSDAKTTLVAFFFLPVFMFVQLKWKKPRLLFTILLFIGFILVAIPTYFPSPFFTDLLSYRDLLWTAYMNNVSQDLSSLLFGIGSWEPESIGIPRFEGFKAHNTFISLLHLNGILALICYLVFILFGIRKHSDSFSVSDGILFLTLTFQLAESNVPLFSFVFPAFIFMINVFLNKEDDIQKESRG
jgi:hypothetical protein